MSKADEIREAIDFCDNEIRKIQGRISGLNLQLKTMLEVRVKYQDELIELEVYGKEPE